MLASGRVEVVGPLPGSGASDELLGLLIADGVAESLLVCLSPVPDRVINDPILLGQLGRDTVAAVALLHPNILQFFGIEVVEGIAYRVQTYVEASSLRQVIQIGGRLPPVIAARILVDVCLAVQFAYDTGKGGSRLQGELSLDSVLVAESGRTLVAGLGGPPPLRPSPESIHLLSPEQIIAGSSALAPQTDVYLLGVLLYLCLMGKPPFSQEPDPEATVLEKSLPSLVVEGIDKPLAEVVTRALAKKAEDRFCSPGALADGITRVVGKPVDPSVVAAYVRLVVFPDDQEYAARRAAAQSALAQRRTPPRMPTPPPELSVPDLVSTADIVIDASQRSRPPDLIPAATSLAEPSVPPALPERRRDVDVVLEPSRPPPQAQVDLVSTVDIVGEVSPPQVGWAAIILVALVCAAVGFCLSFFFELGVPEPLSFTKERPTPAVAADLH